jgi:hypothetical protein
MAKLPSFALRGPRIGDKAVHDESGRRGGAIVLAPAILASRGFDTTRLAAQPSRARSRPTRYLLLPSPPTMSIASACCGRTICGHTYTGSPPITAPISSRQADTTNRRPQRGPRENDRAAMPKPSSVLSATPRQTASPPHSNPDSCLPHVSIYPGGSSPIAWIQAVPAVNYVAVPHNAIQDRSHR